MATESVSVRMNDIAATIDGVSAIIGGFVDHSDDPGIGSSAFACNKLLNILNHELSSLAVQVEAMERK